MRSPLAALLRTHTQDAAPILFIRPLRYITRSSTRLASEREGEREREREGKGWPPLSGGSPVSRRRASWERSVSQATIVRNNCCTPYAVRFFSVQILFKLKSSLSVLKASLFCDRSSLWPVAFFWFVICFSVHRQSSFSSQHSA